MCYVALGIIFQPRELSSSRWQWSSWPHRLFWSIRSRNSVPPLAKGIQLT